MIEEGKEKKHNDEKKRESEKKEESLDKTLPLLLILRDDPHSHLEHAQEWLNAPDNCRWKARRRWMLSPGTLGVDR
jgi:hypothetical protein